MGISQPKTFLAAMKPMIIFHSLIGMEICQNAVAPLPNFLVVVWMLLWNAVYGYMAFIVVTGDKPPYFMDSSPMSALMYRGLAYANIGIAIVSPILACLRQKNLRDWFRMVEILDDRFSTSLGIPREYKLWYNRQIRQIFMICTVFVTLGVADSYWFLDNVVLRSTALMMTFHHPILAMLVIDFTFCNFVRYVGMGFRHLNDSLRGLIEPNFGGYSRGKLVWVLEKIPNVQPGRRSENVGSRNNTKDKREILQACRKIHLELCQLAWKLNFIYGVQNLFSMGISFVMITGLLYTIYSAISVDQSLYDRVREVGPATCWCIIYAIKLLLVNHFCWEVSTESEKTGEIIYEILGPSESRNLQKEIEEFALQLIQNPVKFSACGFFVLDYTHVQGVIGSVTTYLVILIQMGDVPASNKKK